MAFNKKEFAAGFLNQVTDNMVDMREEAEAFKQEQIEASERNRALISTRTARASAAVSLGREALQYLPEGARSKGIIRTAMASGMTGVSELRNKLAKAHANAGLSAGEKLSINDVEAIINMPNIPDIDTKYIDMPLEQFAKETYGATAKAAEFKDDTSIVGRLFGFGAMDRTREELGKRDAGDGMSVADINAASRLAEFNSLIPNAVMSFSDIETFSKTEAFTFAKDISEMYDDAKDSKEALAKAAEEQKRLIDSRPEGEPISYITDAQIADVRRNAIQLYAREEVQKYIKIYAGQYGAVGGFFNQKIAMDQIENIMGKGYLDILKGDYGLDPKKDEADADAVTDEVKDSATEEAKMKELPYTETTVVQPTAESLPPEKHRPGGDVETGDFGNADARRWDRQYGARYNADGTPIIVEPRPTDKEATVMVKNKYSQKDQEKNAQQAWDNKYKKTHNVDGTPKKLKGD
jgi:molybdenum cofactor biosynthesis enzyme